MATDERHESVRRRTADPEHRSASSRRGDWAAFWNDPFASFWRMDMPARRLARDMDRWIRDVGFGRRRGEPAGDLGDWAPEIETFQRGDEFVVRADLPGMTREDIALHVTDNELSIEGERRSEHDEQREGSLRTERSYGSFCRVVPLPEGALGDSARATFRDGVLEVAMNAPPREVSRGRRLEITEPEARETPRQEIFPE